MIVLSSSFYLSLSEDNRACLFMDICRDKCNIVLKILSYRTQIYQFCFNSLNKKNYTDLKQEQTKHVLIS